MTARAVVLSALFAVGGAALYLLASDAGDHGGRPLAGVERDVVLPALARTVRPSLAVEARAASEVLALAAGGGDVRLGGAPPRATCGAREVALPEGFAPEVERMAAWLDRLRASGRHGPEWLAAPDVAPLVTDAWRRMREQQVMVGDAAYRVNRYGIIVRRATVIELLLVPEPVLEAVRRMDGLGGDWDAAAAEYGSHASLWRLADPRGLMPNLLERDRVRRYDPARRRTHLGLVLAALIPNLVESVTIDLAGLLEQSVAPVEGEVEAVVALRARNQLNQMASLDDESYVRQVGPLYLVLLEAEGASVTRVEADGTRLRSASAEIPFASAP